MFTIALFYYTLLIAMTFALCLLSVRASGWLYRRFVGFAGVAAATVVALTVVTAGCWLAVFMFYPFGKQQWIEPSLAILDATAQAEAEADKDKQDQFLAQYSEQVEEQQKLVKARIQNCIDAGGQWVIVELDRWSVEGECFTRTGEIDRSTSD